MHSTIEEVLMLNGIAPSLAQMGQTIEDKTGLSTEELAIFTGQTTPSGWPAAVTVRPDNWNMSLQPATYRIAAGDTLSGLAATYLGSPMRWKEIWSLMPAQFRFANSPDKIMPGDVFLMPDEARDNLKAWIAAGKPTAKKPGQLSKADKQTATAKKYLPYVAGAVVGLGVLWAFSRG